MKKFALALLLSLSFSRSFADLVSSEPTGYPMVDNVLIIGVFAVVVLLIVRRVRQRKKM